MRGATVQVECECCHTEFTARVADRDRGWGRYYSKSCKAKKQPKSAVASNTVRVKEQVPAWIKGVFAGQLFRQDLRDQYEMHDSAMDDMEAGWDGHK